MKFILLFVLLIVSFSDPCRSTAPAKDQCKIHSVGPNCLKGQIVWPYPMSTCQFPISIRSDKTYANIAVEQIPIKWKIDDRQGRELASGVGSFNKTVVEVTNGVVLTLTFPSEINAYLSIIKYHFFD